MAETIKGINVVIGAETTGLSKALGDVDKQARNIQSELRQVDKLLKLDPDNTELLAQKQKLLGDAVDNTKEKLKSLRDAQEQVNDQFAKGQISEGQYRAFQREIAKTEQELKSLESRANTTKKSMAELGESLKGTGDKLSGAGATMSATITAPILAGTALMAKGAADAQVAQGKLQASLGLTADAAADLSAVAEAVWVNGFGENIDEVNRAIINVRQNIGKLAEDDMQKVTESAMTIAQLFEEDVNNVTKTAGVMMKNFKISGQEALDLITVGFQKGGNFSGELLDTLREYSPQFQALGFSAERSLALLISGAEAGAWNLDKVGDAMKEFNIRAKDGSKNSVEAFQALGMNADQMAQKIAGGGVEAQKAMQATMLAVSQIEDPVKRNTIGVQLFGTQWEDLEANVIKAMASAKTELEGVEGATKNAQKAVEENDPFLKITRSLREIQVSVGPALLPIADMISDTVAPALKSLADSFSNMSPSGQKTVLAIVAIIAAIGPLLMVVGGAISVLGSLATIAGTLGIGVGALAGIVGGVVVAIAALVAGGIYLYKNWDTVKAKAKELGDKISEVFSKFKTDAMNWGRNLVEGFWEGIDDLSDWIKKKVYGFAESIGSTIKEFFGIQSPSKLMAEYGQYIAEGLAKGIDDNKGKPQASADLMAESITGAVGRVSEGLSLATDIIKAKFDLWSAKMGETAGQSEIFRARLEMLDAQYQSSTDKIALLQKAYEDMIKAKGAAATESQKLQLELLREQAAQAELAKTIAETNRVQQQSLTATTAESVTRDYLNGLASIQEVQLAWLTQNGKESSWDGKNFVEKTSQGTPSITQNITVQSPTPLSPSETARQMKNASRALAMEW